MKKWISLLMVGLLLCSCTLAQAESEWDKAFAAGGLRLEKVQTDLILQSVEKISGAVEYVEELGLSSELGVSFKKTEDGKMYFLDTTPVHMQMIMEQFGGYRVLSVSPDGALLINFGGTPAILRNKKITLLAPTASRGVQDEYGKIERFLKLFLQAANMPARGGVIWSPNGRYLSFSHEKLLLEQAKLDIDPMLVDTWTGELFLIATFPRSLAKGGGAMAQGAFDASGRKFYYTVYGGDSGAKSTVYCYDLLSRKTELICESENYSYFADLIVAGSGELFSVSSMQKRDQFVGLNRFTPTSSGWKYSHIPFDRAIGDIWSRQVCYSPVTDQALIVGQGYYTGNANMLIKVDLKNIPQTLNEYWIIENGNSKQATKWNWDMPISAETTMADLNQMLAKKMLNLQAVTLSPDGQYAFIATATMGVVDYFLLRLSDMALCKVKVPDEMMELSNLIAAQRGQFLPVAAWNPDGSLLAFGDQGQPVLYQLK